MGIEQDLENEWVELNNYEQQWRAKRDSYPERDFERDPWSVEDHEDTRQMIKDIYGMIARIERRQSVLYRITQTNLSVTRNFWHAVLAGSLAALVFSLYVKWFS